MSDSSFDIEPNYDNCIITQNGDSDSSCELPSILGNETGEHSQHCETTSYNYKDNMDVTCSYLANTKLEPNDFFIFMLGIINRVEKYVDEMDNKEWLSNQIKILKTVLVNNCNIFKVEVENISGSIYIKECHMKENINDIKKLPKVNREKRSDNATSEKDSNSQTVTNYFHDKSINNTKKSSQVHPKTSLGAGNSKSTPKLNRRHSTRLENLKGSDKLINNTLKLPLSSSTPIHRILTKKEYEKICREKKRKQRLKAKSKERGNVTVSEKSAMETNQTLREQEKSRANKNKTKDMSTDKSVAAQKRLSKGKQSNSSVKNKTQSVSFGAETQDKNSSKKTANKKVKSLSSPSKKRINEKEGSQSRKRRRVSLDERQAKKAKVAIREVKSFSLPSSKTTDSVLSSSSSGSTKRRLYSPTSWLHSLYTIMQ